MRLAIGIILAALVIAVGLFVYSDSANKKNQEIIESITPTQIISPTISQNNQNIPSEYIFHESYDYSLKYHPDMEIRNEEPGATSFVLVGPTQKGQTELYDGIIFAVESGNYTQNTFKDFVDSEVKKFEEDGVSQITSGVLSVNIGNKTGYEFSTRSLGEVRQIYLDAGSKKYVHVTLLVDDPSNARFDEVINHMFQSLTFK